MVEKAESELYEDESEDDDADYLVWVTEGFRLF